MSKSSLATVRPLRQGDIEKVLAWRNHPEVRRFMLSQHEILIEEHTQWFARASQDPARHLLMFEIDTSPLGFINIHEIVSGRIANWGFYVAPDAPKDTGRALGQAALRYAFEAAGLNKLCGQVLTFNERSIRFHLNLGFQREGVLRQQHFDGLQYHDVVCFGMLAQEWHHAN